MPNSILLLPPPPPPPHPLHIRIVINEEGSFYFSHAGSEDVMFPCKPCKPSHHVLRSRHITSQRTSTATCARQPQQLNVNQQRMHLIEFKCCEDTRSGQRLDAAQRQRADLCKNISGKAVSLHTIPLGVGGTCYNENTSKLDLDHQQASKLACKLHAHSVKYAPKLVTTRHAIGNKSTPHSQVLEPSASSNPSDPH
eukprot:1142180-Pelagomonas_calceolata.AAC.2